MSIKGRAKRMPTSRTRKSQRAGPKDSPLIRSRKIRRIYNPVTKTYYLWRGRGKGRGASIKGKFVHKEGEQEDV